MIDQHIDSRNVIVIRHGVIHGHGYGHAERIIDFFGDQHMYTIGLRQCTHLK